MNKILKALDVFHLFTPSPRQLEIERMKRKLRATEADREILLEQGIRLVKERDAAVADLEVANVHLDGMRKDRKALRASLHRDLTDKGKAILAMAEEFKPAPELPRNIALGPDARVSYEP